MGVRIGSASSPIPSGPFSLCGDREVPRDIFPLPSMLALPPLGPTECSRKVRRRLERARHKHRVAEDCVLALNSLYSGDKLSVAKSSGERLSLAQRSVMDHIFNSVQCLGPPPDLSGEEALQQLHAFDGYGEDQVPCSVKPYNSNLLSLPDSGNLSVPLAGLLGEDGMDLVGEFCHSRLLQKDEAFKRLAEVGLRHGYSDPRLRIPRVYNEFVGRLWKADIVELVVASPVERIEMFFVGKKVD